MFLITLKGFSQKKQVHIIEKQAITTTIQFELNTVFEITICTKKTNKIQIHAISEGEYANHFVVTEHSLGNTLLISGKIAFTKPNHQDKLSAHKVHAISVHITVPEGLNITVKSNIGNLNISGKYTMFSADLMSGNCLLNEGAGQFYLQSVSGAITVSAPNKSVIEKKTDNNIKQTIINTQKRQVFLKTITGKINILKTQ